jgi:pyruvate dehydrogenase E1 component alpha subunit
MITRIIVPDVGATGGDIRLTAWLVREGEWVGAGQPLFNLESDKASQDIEAFRGGYLRRVLVPAASIVRQGDVLGLLADTRDEIVSGTSEPVTPPAPASSMLQPPRPSGYVAIQPDGMISAEALLAMYQRAVLIRRYEDHLYRLFLQGQVPGTLHQCQGQEAVAVGVCAALRTDDVIFSTHRPVGHLLAKGASLTALTAEIWGKATGCVGGKGGQMHLADVAVGAMPSNAIVGANVPLAVGAALAFKLRRQDRVAVSFFGDGAVNTGAWHEGINLAAVKDAPVVFVCENNLYAASTHVAQTLRIRDIAERAPGYGIPGQVVDGMDVVAVYQSAARAVARARAGGGPTLLECKTYRFKGHSRGDPCGYRDREEFEHWSRRDPVELLRRRLLDDYKIESDRLEQIERACQAEVEAAVDFALASPEPTAADGAAPAFAP